jgi:cytochrome c-type biogenesis protein CcsB
MNSTFLVTCVTFGYLALGIGYLVAQVAGATSPTLRKGLLTLLIAVWAAHTAAIGLRWAESYWMGVGHAPLSNLYESLVFFGWTMVLALLLARWRFRTEVVILLGLPAVFLVMAYTFLQDNSIKPLIPALQSNWLVAHVVTCFLGYAGFAVSFLAAILLMLVNASGPASDWLPKADTLDQIVYRSVLVGFPMLTIGIITGSAWADYAWGSYWSWDPKETWSLITWLVYSGFLHARLSGGWAGTKMALLSVVGFAAVLFTYFGVNYLPGLHSYLQQ